MLFDCVTWRDKWSEKDGNGDVKNVCYTTINGFFLWQLLMITVMDSCSPLCYRFGSHQRVSQKIIIIPWVSLHIQSTLKQGTKRVHAYCMTETWHEWKVAERRAKFPNAQPTDWAISTHFLPSSQLSLLMPSENWCFISSTHSQYYRYIMWGEGKPLLVWKVIYTFFVCYHHFWLFNGDEYTHVQAYEFFGRYLQTFSDVSWESSWSNIMGGK